MKLRGIKAEEHADRDLVDELDSIPHMHIDDNLRGGMTPEQARREALIRLGGVEQVHQAVRDRRGLPWLEVFGRDLKYAMRTLSRTPGFSVVAMLVMAIGIGASVSLFTVVHSVLLRPLPFPDSDRLVAIYSQDSFWSRNAVAPGDFYDWQKATHGYEQLAIWRWTGFNMSASDGLLPGIGASVAVTRLIRSVLYGTNPLDPTVFVLVIVTLLLSSTAACLVPAWRAARINPMHALRAE